MQEMGIAFEIKRLATENKHLYGERDCYRLFSIESTEEEILEHF